MTVSFRRTFSHTRSLPVTGSTAICSTFGGKRVMPSEACSKGKGASLMFGPKDLLALLDKIPAWKALGEAPARLDALEKRVAALELRLERCPGAACPKCGALAMRFESAVGHRLQNTPEAFRIERWTCQECGYADTRQVMERRP